MHQRHRTTIPAAALFEAGKAILTDAGRAKLDELGPWFEGLKIKGSDVVVAAYTDSQTAANSLAAQTLTQKQSEVVCEYLKEHQKIQKLGMLRWRNVKPIGLGHDAPLMPPDPGAPHARLRLMCLCRSEQWAVGSGQWAVGSGQWAVGSGQWAVGSGQWAVGSGEWAVGSGQWAVGSGQWAVGSGQWAVGSGQWAVGSGQWAVGSGQWAVGSGQWAVGSGQWAVGSGQWAVGSGQWAVGSGQWAVGSGQWAVGSGQWAVGSGQWGSKLTWIINDCSELSGVDRVAESDGSGRGGLPTNVFIS